MSAYRSRRIGRLATERLLRGEAGAGDRALTDLLTAAAAPARDDELGGENAAVMAFRTARLQPVPQPRRRSMIKTTLAKLVTAKIAAAAAAVAVVGAGGVAAVAATGHLSSPSGGGAPAAPTTSAAAHVTTDPTHDEHPAGGVDGDTHAPSPSPSLTGLCQAYTAGAGSDHGKALESPAFTVLITTAGGKDKVDAYCADVLTKPHGEHDTTQPDTAAASATAKRGNDTHVPETRDSTHPTGAPATHPSH